VLDATFLGDRGAEQVAELLEIHDTFFQHLKTLAMRNNFIGESGCRALLEAIEPFGELETLDLSRNILTDSDAIALADLLDDPVTDMSFCDSVEDERETSAEDGESLSVLGLSGLRTLQLQENFITCDGFHAITIALCSRDSAVATIGATSYEEEEEEDEESMEVDEEH
jgi:Ran GTPase-activating protein (RanGAP) involved in mRNA processing and transport